MSLIRGIQAFDSPSIDAFGRWRTSQPHTLFDSKNIFNDSDLADTVENVPIFFDNQETSGSGTGTTYDANESSQTLTVSNVTAGTRVRQTRRRFNYEPGKSQLIALTFNMNGNASGITKRVGYFDENDGLFLELDNGSSVSLVRRTNVTGTPVDNAVAQSDWNLDKMNGSGPSGITLDFTKAQIMVIDFQWLGVGRVRMGFDVGGQIVYAHEFLNANVLSLVYMSTPNLPIRFEITNDGTGAADSITSICSSVISEGGIEDIGVIRSASTNGTHVTCTTENTIYAILGLRLKSNYLGCSVKLNDIALMIQSASDKAEWFVLFNPTVAGTFTYADESRSAVQIARGATANTVTGGFRMFGGYIESGGAPSGGSGLATENITNSLLPGSLIDGTPDELVLCVRPIGGSTSVEVEGKMDWRELL